MRNIPFSSILERLKPQERVYWLREPKPELEISTITTKSRSDERKEQLNLNFQRISPFIDELENEENVRKLYIKTQKLLERVIERLDVELYGIIIPSIYMDDDGSINVEWRNDIFKMGIYIPVNSETIHIFGEHLGRPENFLDIRMNESLIEFVIVNWLKKNLIS